MCNRSLQMEVLRTINDQSLLSLSYSPWQIEGAQLKERKKMNSKIEIEEDLLSSHFDGG